MSLKTINKQVADRKLRDTLGKVDGNMAIEIDGGYTYDDLMLLLLEQHAPNFAATSARRYRTSAKALTPHFTGRRLKDIGATILYDYESARRRDGVSGTTIVRDLNCLSSAWGIGTTYWELEKLPNPVLAFLKARKRQHGRGRLSNGPPRERYFSLEEEQKVLAVARPYLHRMIVFAIETGLRLDELLSLERDDVHWEVEQPYLQLWQNETKTMEGRKVPLLARAVAVLREIKAADRTQAAKDSRWVFHKQKTGARYGKVTRGRSKRCSTQSRHQPW